ncbi:MAG: hypothetical protein ACI9TF_000320 [Paracrocinitomix sp.]|jgi:hypothetical protein
MRTLDRSLLGQGGVGSLPSPFSTCQGTPMVAPLAPGATMPAVFAKDLEGNDVDIVASVAGNWAIIQFYRGDW